MDMLKKARGKALAAVKEVQKEVQGITQIIQTPSQQQAGYQNAAYNHTPYQQYGQQHPPQLQNFQSQYAGPTSSSTYPSGHPQQQQQQQQSVGQNQYNSNVQYSQYGQPQTQQPHGVPQPYGQAQPQYGTAPQQHQHQQQPQQHPQQYNQQGHVISSPQLQQYSTPQIPPPYSPSPNTSQAQASQVSGYGSQSQTPLTSPQSHPGAQPYQQPLQYQAPSPNQYQQQQTLSSPVQTFNPNQFPGSPQSQQSLYSTPGISQEGQHVSPHQPTPQPSGYFPAVAPQPNTQPNYAMQPSSQQSVVGAIQQPGFQRVSSPLHGTPQTASSPLTTGQQMPQQNIHLQQTPSNFQTQSPPIPPRQSISSPSPQYPQQVSQPSNPLAHAFPPQPIPQPLQGQGVSPYQANAVGSAPQIGQFNHPTQSPINTPSPQFSPSAPPPVPTVPGGRMSSPPPLQGHQSQQVPAGRISSPPPVQVNQSQQVPEGRISSPPPVLGSQPQPLPGNRISSPVPTQSQQFPQTFQQPTVVAHVQAQQQQQVSPPPPAPKVEPFVAARPPSPSLTPAPLNLRPRANSTLPPPEKPSSPPPTQYQTFGGAPDLNQANKPPAIEQSVNVQQQAKIKSPSPPPTSTYQAYGGGSGAPPAPLSTRPTPNENDSANRVQQTSSPPPTTQYQAFSGSNPNLETSQGAPPRQETISPPPSQYQAFVGDTQSPVQTYAAFKPTNPSDHPVSPPKPTPAEPFRSASISSQGQASGRLSPQSQSPAQTAPQFPPPHAQRSSSIQISPQSRFTTPAPTNASPQLSTTTPAPQHSYQQNPAPTQTFELPSGPYDVVVPRPQADPPARQASVSSGPIEYADGLMLADEDSHFVPVVRNTVNRPSYTPLPATRKMKCSGFEPTLTDINQYFELRPDLVKQHNIPYNDGGAFAICEYCFHTFLEPHPWFASLFYPRPRGERPTDKNAPQLSFEKLIGCGMAFPRIRQVILGQTIPSRNVQPFIDYAKLDATLPPCTGEPQTGDYYGSQAIGSIALCISCFECYIKNTAFEQHFYRVRAQSPDQQWACDVGYSGYVHRVLLADIAQNPPNFGHFVVQANKRLAMPPCTGHKQPIACSGPQASTIFRSVKDNCGVFCSGCFHDIVVGTEAERDFGYEIEIDDDQKAGLSCDLTFPFSNEGMIRAVQAKNFDVWHAPIVSGNTTALCPSIAGHDEAQLMEPDAPMWYCFKEFPSIEVCARCYGMQMVQAQAQELFVPITRQLVPGRIRQCYMSPAKDPSCMSWNPMDYENTTAWRGQYLRNVINYCRDAGGDFTLAREAAARIAALPPACGSELRKFFPPSGRKFFGHQATNPNDKNDATILMCEECFQYIARDTPMESFFAKDLTDLAYRSSPEGHRCSTWSIQTKKRLHEACLTNTFVTYAQYHHKREAVFEALWQSIRELQPLNELLKQHTANINMQTQLNLQMNALRLQQQMNTQMNVTMMGIGASVSEAAATETRYRYGNSTVGMNYLTPGGANAAMAHHQAANLPGLNLAMWEGASTERLSGEVRRRLAIQDDLREQWRILD